MSQLPAAGLGNADTDPGRDRFIDFLRVSAMAAVVFLHWLSVMPHLANGRFTDELVVKALPQLWPLTWLGDVMALFFFAGGYANWKSMQAAQHRGETWREYLAERFRRLVLPVLGFVGVWAAAELVATVVGLGRWAPLRHVWIGSTTPFGPLWFIGVYLVLVALSPLTAAVHRRWGLAVPVAMALAVALADTLAVVLGSGAPLILNLVLVWSVPHQLGYFYADGRMKKLSLTACAVMAAGGLLLLVVLTSLPVYPRDLFGPRWKVLTMDAPTLPLVAEAVWFVGFAMVLRPYVERLLSDPGRWRAVSRANRYAMPVYLWHMTAYLMAVLVLGAVGSGFAYATVPTATWWWGRPLVIALSGVFLVGTLAVTTRIQGLMRHPFAPLSLRSR
jgi:surface polysaccharide O-acyltransferase-like enzyme